MPQMTPQESEALALEAGKAFSPRTPISNRALFAGRWHQLQTIADTVGQVGLHAVIFGERGVGKTSLTHIISPLLVALDREHRAEQSDHTRIVVRVNANVSDTFSTVWTKALNEITWVEDRPVIGFVPPSRGERVSLTQAMQLGDSLSIDDVRRVLSVLPGSVFVFDEFDRLPKANAAAFTDLIKALSDSAMETTIVLVGVAETVEDLMRDHESIGRALTQIRMPRMSEEELDEILKNAEKVLRIEFTRDARAKVIRMSQGLPHFTHLIGLHSVRAAARRLSRKVESRDVQTAFNDAVSEADQTVASAYASAIRSAQPGAKYAQVLLAAAIAAFTTGDEFGYFQPSHLVEPMTRILGRQEEIAGFNQHLAQFMEDKRGAVLERTGRERAYRYRFTQPLLPPYVVMRSVRDGIVDSVVVDDLLAG